jgi:hypothetical protein
MPGSFLIITVPSVLLAFMIAKAFSPWARPRPGLEQLQLRPRLRQRLLLYRYYILGVLGVFLSVRIIPGAPDVLDGSDVIALFIIVAWLLTRVTYHFTDQGFSLRNGRFYHWSEFGSFRRAGSIVQLRGPDGRGSTSLYLNRAQQQAVLPILRSRIGPRTGGSASDRRRGSA